MKVIKKLSPGEHGSLKYETEWADKLVCVRYRDDPVNQRRLTTIEIIVEERKLVSKGGRQQRFLNTQLSRTIGVKIDIHEKALQEHLKQKGAKWNADIQLWLVQYSVAIRAGLRNRVIELEPK